MAEAAHSLLVVDGPSRDVPDTLARADDSVVVHGTVTAERAIPWGPVRSDPRSTISPARLGTGRR